jgi:hypothetical protein
MGFSFRSTGRGERTGEYRSESHAGNTNKSPPRAATRGEGEEVRQLADDLSRYRRPMSAAFAPGPLHRRSIVNGNILNSEGVRVAVVTGHEVYSLRGQKLYILRGGNLYKLNGDLVGHLADAGGAEKHLDKSTDRLFPGY